MTIERKEILCVDDDQDLLDAIQIILQSGNFKVVTANSRVDGVAKYRASRPDLIFVDLMMEEVDSGINFIKEIRKDGPTPPVILLSSVGAGVAGNVDASSMGFTAVLQKPVDPDHLLRLVRSRLLEKE